MTLDAPQCHLMTTSRTMIVLPTALPCLRSPVLSVTINQLGRFKQQPLLQRSSWTTLPEGEQSPIELTQLWCWLRYLACFYPGGPLRFMGGRK